MPLYLTDDQNMLRDTARDFMAAEGSIKTQLRHWRDAKCKDGFGHALWKQFAEMGFTGVLVPEADGGLGLGHVEAGIVLEEIGRNLTPSPFLTTAVAFVEAVKGSAVRERYLPGVLSGETVAALALDEGRKHRPEGIAMRAERSATASGLNGDQELRRAWRLGRRGAGGGADRGQRGRDRGADPVRGGEGRGRVRRGFRAAGGQLDGGAAHVRRRRGRCRRGGGEVDQGGPVLTRLLNAGAPERRRRWSASRRARWT
jgi:hypothetical protein